MSITFVKFGKTYDICVQIIDLYLLLNRIVKVLGMHTSN